MKRRNKLECLRSTRLCLCHYSSVCSGKMFSVTKVMSSGELTPSTLPIMTLCWTHPHACQRPRHNDSTHTCAHMRTHTLNTKNRGLHPSRRGRPSFCASLKMDESTCTPGVPRHSELSSPPCRLCPANAAHTHRDEDAACVALVIFQVQPLECRPHDFAWPAPCFVDVSHWVGHTSQR